VGYANGPGFAYEPSIDEQGNTVCNRPLPSATESQWSNPKDNAELKWPASAETKSSETHGGDDVAVTAQGPWVCNISISNHYS